jgi:gluconolactonase
MLKRWYLVFVWLSYVSAQSPVPAGAVLEKISGGYKFVEGPLWSDGDGLLFSDIQANSIYRWSAADSVASVYLRPSDSSNGLTFDMQGRLILTQMAKRRVSRREPDGTITPLVSTYNGKRFNSPNDVIVRADGSIFFTDPDFNIPVGQKAEMPIRGIYRISPYGSLQLLDSTFDKPNGICLSPDQKKLYVNESAKGRIYSWDFSSDSTLTGKKLLYTIPTTGYADGMKTDTAGNIYCAGPTGVWIVSPSGSLLGKIPTPEGPTNCAWGGADRKTLFITAGTSVYRIRLTTTGVRSFGAAAVDSYELFANYPNPFNPSTTIGYQLKESAFVHLDIYNDLGQEITTLINERQEAGRHSVVFTPGLAASGMYVCRISAGGFVGSQKMLYTK